MLMESGILNVFYKTKDEWMAHKHFIFSREKLFFIAACPGYSETIFFMF